MTPVTTIGTQYRRIPTPGTKLAIQPGPLSVKNIYSGLSPYRAASLVGTEVRRALVSGHGTVTAESADSTQSMKLGFVKNLAVNGQVIVPGPVQLPVRDLYRIA